MLPRAVLSTNNTVLVANENNKLEVRPVSVVRAEPRLVYINDGLKSGEWVITTLMDAPIPGTQVAVNGRDKPSSGLDTGDDGAVASVGTEQ